MRSPASRRKRDTKKKAGTAPSPEAPAQTDDAADRDAPGTGAFPIVGVGASAGGLEAFTQLLTALPLDTGMGFVLVQHLDPDHESQLAQILARATSLPVNEITHDQRVQPNHVHIIPRDTNLSIAEGVLKLQPRPKTRAPHRPIDTFFESLAQDRRELAVGVVLSGTASDGTLGLEVIKAEGGITFAQDDSAKHDSMPRSAVAAGCVDFVLSPAEIARELARIAKHPYVAGQAISVPEQGETNPEEVRASSHGNGTPRAGARHARAEAKRDRGEGGESKPRKRAEDGYRKILVLLRNHSGVDFSLYKATTIQRRIARRLVLNKHDTLEAYAAFLRGNDRELDALYSDVLISVTSFFRNPETFDVLQHRVLPKLLERRSDDPIRVWVPGCSTGQEAYSIAIAFAEAAEKTSRVRKLQVFATDLNEALLEKARHGLYAKSLADDISPQRLRRFFVAEDGGYRVSKALRETVVFARQNLIADPPFSRMDLVSCRNLLIYLEPGLQKSAIPTFHYALRPGGVLLLGASESIGGFTDLFEPVDKKHKIYSRRSAPTPTLHLPARAQHGEGPTGSRPPLPLQQRGGPDLPQAMSGELNAQREADRLTVNQFAPPAVLVNAELQVLQFRGSTGAFLEPPVGKASFDLLNMAREGLMLPLRSALQQARKDNQTARKQNVRVRQNGTSRTVNLEVIPLKNLRERCFLIVFEEAENVGRRREPAKPQPARKGRTPRGEAPSRIAELEAELSEMREYLQFTQQQHEAGNEELQAANEEVQSANEELQSVNEELETSKEELESANEELTTVNEEMSNRNVELNRLNNDLVNLQASTKLAILLFGRDLTIRRFSPQAEKQFDLLVTDVGRPVGHIRHRLVEVVPALPSAANRQTRTSTAQNLPLDLEGLVAEVIADVREQQREVLDKNGHWCSVRVRPYMTLDNKVDGAVLVLIDIDAVKRSEQAVAMARDYAQNTVDTVREALLVLDDELYVESANRAFYRVFRVAPAEAIGKRIYDLGNGQWDIPRLRELLEGILPQSASVEDFEIEHDFAAIGRRTMLLNARRMQDADPQREGQRILVAIADVTERKRAEAASGRLAAIVESSDDPIISKTLDGLITSWNRGAEKMFGFTAAEALGQHISLIVPAELRAEEDDVLARLRHGETVEHLETERRTKDGRRISVLLTISPIKDAAGRTVGASKVARDITERKRMEDELRKYTADLSEAAERRDEFLAMLGHELRNPLSALAHGLEFQGKVRDDRERSEKLRAMMVRQTDRIGALLDQLLDIARVISGKVELSKRRVDLREVVRAAVETVEPFIEAQRHELTVTLSSDSSALVSGDAVRLTQVVENLLTNAAKYTNEGGRIAVALQPSEDSVRIFIADNGAGIDAELLPHIFEVFTQAPRTLDRAKGGLGLGLPLVRRLVEMHGGRVSVASPGLGLGSEFVVTLPRLLEIHSDEQVEREKSARSPAEPGKVRPRRILLVDDEQDTAGLLADLLETEGHQTLTVGDGRTALSVVHTFDPEVVLLDLGLPEMDGYEVARRLREELGDKKVLLIAATGYQSDAVRLKQAGFDEHLIKPTSVQKLSALLAALDNEERRTR